MHPILLKLKDGDLRTTGRADEVAELIASDPALFAVVFEGMRGDDAGIRMRAADAVEKATRRRPDLLQPYKASILNEIVDVEQKEVRWHVAQMLPRLALGRPGREKAVAVLKSYLDDESRIVRTNAMQALADLAGQDDRLRPIVIALIEHATATGSPAMRARGRKLLTLLRRPDET